MLANRVGVLTNRSRQSRHGAGFGLVDQDVQDVGPCGRQIGSPALHLWRWRRSVSRSWACRRRQISFHGISVINLPWFRQRRRAEAPQGPSSRRVGGVLMSTVVVAASAADAQAVEAVKSHHAHLAGALAAHVESLVEAAARDDLPAAGAAAGSLVRWCDAELIPHALAEEQAMYPQAHEDP